MNGQDVVTLPLRDHEGDRELERVDDEVYFR
jgi:hypothetical protein